VKHDQIWGGAICQGPHSKLWGLVPLSPPVIYAQALNGRREPRYKGYGFTTLRRARLALRWVTVGLVYVTSHSGQLSLPPSAGPEMSTGQEWLALFAWEGNRRSGVASHRPCVHHGLNGLLRGDQYLAYAHIAARQPFPIRVPLSSSIRRKMCVKYKAGCKLTAIAKIRSTALTPFS